MHKSVCVNMVILTNTRDNYDEDESPNTEMTAPAIKSTAGSRTQQVMKVMVSSGVNAISGVYPMAERLHSANTLPKRKPSLTASPAMKAAAGLRLRPVLL